MELCSAFDDNEYSYVSEMTQSMPPDRAVKMDDSTSLLLMMLPASVVNRRSSVVVAPSAATPK